jgi:Protein-L-isoaspartate carboxylmethyltransferase
VLAEIAKQVYTIETIPELAQEAKARLHRLGFTCRHKGERIMESFKEWGGRGSGG